jgi:hypothetical protein
MDMHEASHHRVEWHLSEQHLAGTPEDVAAQLDELIVSLVACRQWLSAGGAQPAQSVQAPARLLTRLLTLIGLSIVLLLPTRLGAQTTGPGACAPASACRFQVGPCLRDAQGHRSPALEEAVR